MMDSLIGTSTWYCDVSTWNRHTVFSRLNAPGVYLKFGNFYPTFIRSRRLIEKIRYSHFSQNLALRIMHNDSIRERLFRRCNEQMIQLFKLNQEKVIHVKSYEDGYENSAT